MDRREEAWKQKKTGELALGLRPNCKLERKAQPCPLGERTADEQLVSLGGWEEETCTARPKGNEEGAEDKLLRLHFLPYHLETYTPA